AHSIRPISRAGICDGRLERFKFASRPQEDFAKPDLRNPTGLKSDPTARPRRTFNACADTERIGALRLNPEYF
ncbi:MAG: hypothetical protein WAK41_11910, partial [Roseiarcus sp.]|uniref:hypothetical protein n=1 Tax=Roseiarcus sp. TaxID=1969460 RepID=UPI003BAF0307